MTTYSLIVAWSMGFLGGAHCISMCGGIMGALTAAIPADHHRKRLWLIVFYNLGRISGYLLIAWLFYHFIHQLQQYFAWQFMRYVAGFLVIAMGLYLADWWRGLRYLEKIGGYFWRLIQPVSTTLLPVNTPTKAFFLGTLWGWLPCGLVYSALAYAATADTAIQAMSIMLAFATGTLPAVMVSGFLANKLLAWLTQAKVRQSFAMIIIVFGVWTLWYAHLHHHQPTSNMPADATQQHH